MIGVLLIITTLYVLMVVIGCRLETRDQRRAELLAREQDRARAQVLLHATHRERQLADLEHGMQRRSDEQLWRWGRGDWGRRS